MLVRITKDYYDGSKSKEIEYDLENGLTGLSMQLMLSGVSSITITKIVSIQKMVSFLQNPKQPTE